MSALNRARTAFLGITTQRLRSDVVAMRPGEDAMIKVGGGEDGRIIERTLQRTTLHAVACEIDLGNEAIVEAKVETMRTGQTEAGNLAIGQGGGGVGWAHGRGGVGLMRR